MHQVDATPGIFGERGLLQSTDPEAAADAHHVTDR